MLLWQNNVINFNDDTLERRSLHYASIIPQQLCKFCANIIQKVPNLSRVYKKMTVN